MTRPGRRSCLTPGCGGPCAHKGLCPKCYGQAKREVEAGRTSWERLAEVGLAEIELTPFLKAARERLGGGAD